MHLLHLLKERKPTHSPRTLVIRKKLTSQSLYRYIIAKFPETDYDYIPDSEARVTYVVVQPNSSHHGQPQYAPKPNAGPANQPPNSGYGTTAPPVHQDQSGAWTQPAANVSGEGSSGGAVPPTYEQAIRGDHKIQTRD